MNSDNSVQSTGTQKLRFKLFNIAENLDLT